MALRSNSKEPAPFAPLNVDSLLQPGQFAGAGASTYAPLPTEPYPAWASGESEDKPPPQPSQPVPTPKPYEPLPREPDTRDGGPGENKIIEPEKK